MFKNNEREFAISLPKQPKCKREEMSLSLLVPSLNPHPCSGLSKVAGCQQKSPPTWLVSSGYSAWHFFMDGVF